MLIGSGVNIDTLLLIVVCLFNGSTSNSIFELKVNLIKNQNIMAVICFHTNDSKSYQCGHTAQCLLKLLDLAYRPMTPKATSVSVMPDDS